MEINVNFVLFEELKEKPSGDGIETHIVIIRQSRDSNLALEDGAADFHSAD